WLSSMLLGGGLWRLVPVFFFSSRRRHTRLVSDWSSDVCSSDLNRCVCRHRELYDVSSRYMAYARVYRRHDLPERARQSGAHALVLVERAFRTLKGVDMLVRPVHHWLSTRVRAQVLVRLLAYYVEHHMRRASPAPARRQSPRSASDPRSCGRPGPRRRRRARSRVRWSAAHGSARSSPISEP